MRRRGGYKTPKGGGISAMVRTMANMRWYVPHPMQWLEPCSNADARPRLFTKNKIWLVGITTSRERDSRDHARTMA